MTGPWYTMGAAVLLAVTACRPSPQEFDSKLFHCDQSMSSAQCTTSAEGKPNVCFAAGQLGGQDFCTESCDGDVQTSSTSQTTCLASGAQLTRCSPSASAGGSNCPHSELSCYRTDLLGDEGVCTTFEACSKDEDCTATARRTCMSSIFQLIYPRATHLQLTNLYCLQDQCGQQGSSCRSDEICLPNLVPESTRPIDVCVPKCDSHLNCPPNLVCYRKVSGPAAPPVCVAGILGFKCSTSNDCIMGDCIDVGTGFNLCSIPCASDGDCAEFNGTRGNFMCLEPTPGKGKYCIASESFTGAPCGTDDDCHPGEVCSFYSPYTAVTNAGSCLVPCDGNGQCPARGGVAHTCLPLAAPLRPVCYPGNIGLPCTDDGACLPGMTCMTARRLTRDDVYVEGPVCTASCTSNADCGQDRLHATLEGWCDQGLCALLKRGDTLCADDAECAAHSCGPSVRALEIGTGIRRCAHAPGDPPP